MIRCKIIATDLDGTLLSSNAELSEENSKAIVSLAEAGVLIVPTTGRSSTEVPKSVLNHPSIRYVITSNGAALFDKKSGEKLSAKINKSDVTAFVSELKKYQCALVAHINGKTVYDSVIKTERGKEFYRVSPYFSFHFSNYGEAVDNIEEYLSGEYDVEFVCAFFHDANERELCDKRLTDMGYSVAASDSVNLEIFSSEAGKGKMVLRLCKKLGISKEEIITIGDSRNDISMMSATENSFATSNASQELKACAKHIACSNDEHIMKYFLEKVIELDK